MSKATNHIHKYQRALLGSRRVVKRDGKRYIETSGGYEVFKCMLPGCKHYIARELVIGAKSICWRCNTEMVLNMENTTLKKPTHPWCRRIKEKAA